MQASAPQRVTRREVVSGTTSRRVQAGAVAADQKVDQFQTGPASSDFMQVSFCQEYFAIFQS